MAITFKQLRYFLTLAEELHFGRAAEKLNISQPPLSASLKQLEHALGFPLMERTNKMVRLTPAGATFAEHARRMLNQLSAAETIAAQMAKGAVGKVTVAFVPSMLFRQLPPLLKTFQENHPDIELILHEMNTTRQIEALLDREIDIGFVHKVPFPPDIAQHTLETERLVCCVPRDHRLAGCSRIRLSELAGERVLTFSREFAAHFHDRIAGLLRVARVETFPHYHIRHWFTVVALVGQGMGVALVPQSLRNSAFANVAYLEIEEREAEHQVSLIWHRDAPPQAARLFLQFVSGGLHDAPGRAL